MDKMKWADKPDKKYRVTNDTIYFESADNEFKSLYKILDFKNDTLRLVKNKKYFEQTDTVSWVRFPDGELGHFDLTWTNENRDSLNEKVAVDWNRRMWKYYSMKNNDMKRYDSLLRAGFWTWTMKDIKEKKRLIER